MNVLKTAAPGPMRSWAALRHAMRGLRRRSMFLGIRWLVRRCGFAGLRKFGARLGTLHYLFGWRIRRRCIEGLAACTGRDVGDPVVADTLRTAYRVNTIAVLEVLCMIDRKLDSATLARHCRVDGIANLEAARVGRGAILIATHSGNSLLLAVQLAAAGLPVSVVYRHTRMMSKEFFATGLPRYGLEGILANEGFRAYTRMLDALRRNRVLFAMMDQGVARVETGLPLRFLGKDMPMPAGIVQLARQSRAPMVPVTTVAADPQWRFSLGPHLDIAPGGSIESDTAEVLRHLENQIRTRPQLWSWPHRRWRNFPIAGAM